MRIKNEEVKHMPRNLVPYSREEPQYLPTTFGCNEKGGMINEEFVEYAMNVWHIFNDIADIPGKRICYKVDSGPGRGQIVLNAALRAQGVCIFPGVPNTTAITQEMDERYGLLKPDSTRVSRNCKPIDWLRGSHCPLQIMALLFLEEMRMALSCQTFLRFISRKKRTWKSWKKSEWFHALALVCKTQKLLCHEIVEHDGVIDVDADPLAAKMADIVCMNTMACNLLLASGYADGSVFQKTLRIHDIAKKEAALTLPYSKERQEALLKASLHGQQFKITGGAHVTSGNFFISHQLGLLLKEIATLKSEKGQDWMLLLMKQRRLLS
jgi:hypothetical protein